MIEKSNSPAPELITRVPTAEELAPGFQGQTPITHFYGAEYRADAVGQYEASLLKDCEDPGVIKTVHGILYEGIDPQTGRELRTADVARNIDDELGARQRLAYIATHSPEAYGVLRDEGIIGFHGTRSIALAGILRTGEMRSARLMHESQGDGVVMLSGEHVANGAQGQASISFSGMSEMQVPFNYAAVNIDETKDVVTVLSELRDKFDAATISKLRAGAEKSSLWASQSVQANHYERAIKMVEAKPKDLEAVLMTNDFPVLVGLRGDFVDEAEQNPDPRVEHRRTLSGQSGQNEFRPLAASIPCEELIFAVPAARAEGTRNLLAMFGRDNPVIAIEDIGPAKLYRQAA